MHREQFNKDLFDFLQSCPTPFHTADHLGTMFQKAGFRRLAEGDEWKTEAGNGYYSIRDNGTFLAFRLAADNGSKPFRMLGAHSDSPSLQVKPTPERNSHGYNQLGVEVYGGPLLHTWFDRDLGIGGRITLLSEDTTVISRVIDFKKAVATIPSLAIHLDREANKEHTVEKQKQLLPLVCLDGEEEFSFSETLLQRIKEEYPELDAKEVLAFDLFCYDTQPPALTGVNGEFISASRLDNLVSCFVGAKSLLQEETYDNCLLLCSNHEEIGSQSVAGARGNFLASALARLVPDAACRHRLLHRSLMISMDNAHALHPNFPEKHDPQHQPLLNHGPAIKYNAGQRYASTSRSAALFKMVANEADIPVQEFVMHNDLPCGSTIGPATASSLGVQTVDVGVPSLAMHSIRETIGAEDPYMLFQAIAHFFTRPQLPEF